MGWTDDAPQGWLYRCVPAPRRARKGKGHKTPVEALAGAMEAAIAAEAAQGWEYLRTDLLPMEARASLLGAVAESHQAIMVFRRPAPLAAVAADRRAETAPRDRHAVEPPRLGAARID